MGIRRGRRGAFVVVVVLCGIVLSGCSPSNWSNLYETDQAEDDSLPADAGPANVIASLVPGSTRLQWSSDEVSYYSAQSVESSDIACLVVYESAEVMAACSVSDPIVLERDDGAIALGDIPPEQGWEQLSDHLWREP